MTCARIQPSCKKYDINIGYFDGTRINPRNITQRNSSLFIYNNHFCLIWKSTVVSFNHAIEDWKLFFKVVDIIIFDKHVLSFVKNEYNPKQVQSPLTFFIVSDLETYNKKELFPFSVVY